MINKNRKEVTKTMNATRATATMTSDGGVFGTTTEIPPEDPPPRESGIGIPRWLVCAIIHALLHIAMNLVR